MERSKANEYVINLFETFSIEKNQLLGKEWRDALANYDEAVVKEGWDRSLPNVERGTYHPSRLCMAS